MSSFSVPVVRIADVFDHPKADRLSINKILGYEAITAKREDGSHQFAPGDLVAYIPEDAIVPEYLLKREGFWNEEKGTGMLAGTAGNRVKCIKLREIYSQGLLIPTHEDEGGVGPILYADTHASGSLRWRVVEEGMDVAEFLGITKREIVIPERMAGEVYASHATIAFDFDSLQKQPDLFADGEEVEVTEKLHGTFCQIGVTSEIHEDAFGRSRVVYITSKGLGSQGRALKNNETNRERNLYVRTILATPLIEHLEALTVDVRVFGEVFGRGVQDLHYGATAPEFRVFDIKVNSRYQTPDEVARLATEFGLTTVPVLYRGPFSMAKMIELRDGKDTLSGSHIREGVVIRSVQGPRKIAKLVSPYYLTRKGNVTEFQ